MTEDTDFQIDGLENELHKNDEVVEEKPKKKRRKKKKFKNTEEQKTESKTVKLRALKNFMLWDRTMAREGEVVEVPKFYAERLLTHTPKAFERA